MDQKSYLVPGDHGMIIGYATGFPETSTTLDLIVRPGGLLFVGSDGVASAGTVTYQNPA